MLSVVVPVYNVENTLDRCIQSIVSQSYDAMEILLIDDGSTDSSPRLCDEWAEKDTRISVVHQRNKGLSGARNTGIELAQGQWITFVDSDDQLAPDTYRQIMAEVEQTECDLLEYQARIDVGSKQESQLTLPDKTYYSYIGYWFDTEAYRHCYAWNKIYRRNLFQSLRYPEGKTFEDVYLLPLLIRKAQSIKTSPKGTYIYYTNPKGISKQTTPTHISDFLHAHMQILPSMLQHYKQHEVSRSAISRYYLYVLNIQITHHRITGETLLIPTFRPTIIANRGLPTLLKTLMLQVMNPSALCRLMTMGRKKH